MSYNSSVLWGKRPFYRQQRGEGSKLISKSPSKEWADVIKGTSDELREK